MLSGWADQRLGRLYIDAEAIADTLTNGSTEQGCIREALAAIELADTYVEKRQRDENE